MTTGSDTIDESVVERFEHVSSGEVADTKLDAVSVLGPDIDPVHTDCEVVGTARTVTLDPSALCAPVTTLEKAHEGEVIVVDADDRIDEAVWGELLSRYAAATGVRGVITNGAIRDVTGIRDLGFPTFAKGRTPRGPSGSEPAERAVPVTVGGSSIEPGDILVGDETGVVVVKRDDATDVIEAAEEVAETEQGVRQKLDEGETLENAL